ncbi:unnamed protein product [Paramecium sonneborni]|uniref:Uncharacterized protein n=1 Tax=Paramecium sonneborni TaxID=65129 RepID=A0A8S1Q048_9CILI|nr:unnamed protein product [Paramecium sonneborni]
MKNKKDKVQQRQENGQNCLIIILLYLKSLIMVYITKMGLKLEDGIFIKKIRYVVALIMIKMEFKFIKVKSILIFLYIISDPLIYVGEFKDGIKYGRWDTLQKGKYDQEYKLIGGGSYHYQNAQLKKIGFWIEEWKNFGWKREVMMSGEYNLRGYKVGQWDIIFKEAYGRKQFKLIGGGFYMDQEGGSIKIGNWVELQDKFYNYSRFSLNGKYNHQGVKTGRWSIYKNVSLCGCINYDENGIEIYKSEKDPLIYVGQFKEGKKYGRWDILYKGDWMRKYKQIGGGSFYLKNGDSQKIGKWCEVSEEFHDLSRITYQGVYNDNGHKKGQWNIYQNWEKNNKIGGGFYFEYNRGSKKIGKWTEEQKNFERRRQIMYNGNYNMNGNKVGIWNILFQDDYGINIYKQIGGGLYEEQEGQSSIKVGKWIELSDNYTSVSQITYHGLYNKNGVKIGRWDIYKKDSLCGCINYDQNGIQIYKSENDPLIYVGEFKDGIKYGRWDTLQKGKYDQEYKLIGGGSYHYQNAQLKKIGFWIEVEDVFFQTQQIINHGQYNEEGKKVGTWVKINKQKNFQIMEKTYDN